MGNPDLVATADYLLDDPIAKFRLRHSIACYGVCRKRLQGDFAECLSEKKKMRLSEFFQRKTLGGLAGFGRTLLGAPDSVSGRAP